ncbi:MAG: aminopeptidase P N-terminal domain-containing protein [Candidatus Microsaccharimonas sp.]
MINAEEYTQRRNSLVAVVARPIILSAQTEMQARSDTEYRFVQDATFFYYTGINEPNWKLIFDGKDWKLAQPKISDVHEIFNGSLSLEDIRSTSGIDAIISQLDYTKLVTEIAKQSPEIATLCTPPYEKYYNFTINPARKKLETSLKRIFQSVYDCRPEVNRQRAIKSQSEIDEIKQAVAMTSAAFEMVRRQLTQYNYEYEIEADLSRAYRFGGLEGHAYEPIVASGENACTLHYIRNNHSLSGKGLILIDSGAKTSDGYVADITRTYSLNSVTAREMEIHSAVEKAHRQIIKLIMPGVSLREYQNKVDVIMKNALISVGLLKSKSDDKTYRHYFPHAVGHGLGIDVHESLGGFETFQVGMVLTVEPGIYIPEEAIGVRIEDDILVTKTGHENLSVSLSTAL